MQRLLTYLVSFSLIAAIFWGCGSADETAAKQEQPSPSVPSSSQTASQKTDTVNANIQNNQRPVYEQSVQQGAPSGKFSVQIGAYKMQDNAERIAALARERFSRNVYTIPDKVNDLYKVMVGEFMVKDEARRFRDEMVQRYPSDYKDAWVSELQQ